MTATRSAGQLLANRAILGYEATARGDTTNYPLSVKGVPHDILIEARRQLLELGWEVDWYIVTFFGFTLQSTWQIKPATTTTP